MSLYTYLTYGTEQIWLPCCKDESHNYHSKWAHRPNRFAHIYQNITNCTSYFTHYFQIGARNKYAPQMPYIRHIYKFMHTYETTISVYFRYELTAINNVTRSIGTHTFHIMGNPDTLYIYMPPLYCYCSIHTYPTLLHTEIKKKTQL